MQIMNIPYVTTMKNVSIIENSLEKMKLFQLRARYFFSFLFSSLSYRLKSNIVYYGPAVTVAAAGSG